MSSSTDTAGTRGARLLTTVFDSTFPSTRAVPKHVCGESHRGGLADSLADNGTQPKDQWRSRKPAEKTAEGRLQSLLQA